MTGSPEIKPQRNQPGIGHNRPPSPVTERSAPRQAALRERRRAAGWVRLDIDLPPPLAPLGLVLREIVKRGANSRLGRRLARMVAILLAEQLPRERPAPTPEHGTETQNRLDRRRRGPIAYGRRRSARHNGKSLSDPTSKSFTKGA